MEILVGYIGLVIINYWVILACHRYLVKYGTEFNGMFLFVSLILIVPTIILMVTAGYTFIYNLDLDYNQIFDWVLPKTVEPPVPPTSYSFREDVIRDLERERCWAKTCHLIDTMFPNHGYTEAQLGGIVRNELDLV